MLKKLIGSFIVSLAIFFSITSGQSTTRHDCALIAVGDINFPTRFSNIINENNGKTISRHLRTYCCHKGLLRNTENNTSFCTQNSKEQQNIYPQSEYLFDHIIDMILRKLDANSDQLYPGIEADPIGKSRRDYINNIAISTQYIAPTQIVEQAKQYRNTQTQGPSILINKYKNACEDALEIYKAINPSPNLTADITSNLNKCNQMIHQRILLEMEYTKSIISLASNRMLNQYIERHLKDYFANNRINSLQNTMSEMLSAFRTVNRFVIEGTPRCS